MTDIEQKISTFFEGFTDKRYPKGQILIFAGESPDNVYYLRSGRVSKYQVSYRGEEVVVNVFKPGSFFPMSWALNQSENKYFYKTESAVRINVAPEKEAVDFLKNNPDVMLDLLTRLYKGTEGVLGRMVQLMAGSAKSRVAYEIEIELARFGDKGSKEIEMSETYLASRTGLARETVSREINKLKTLGIIEVQGKSIVIKDEAKLNRLISGV